MVRGSLGIALSCAIVATCAVSFAKACESLETKADAYRVATVVGADARVNFLAGADTQGKPANCPNAGAVCRLKPFVVRGDKVLISRDMAGFACATFVSARGTDTTGWLPASSLDMAKPAAFPLAKWRGSWKRTEAKIVLEVAGDKIKAEGDATYGSLDPGRVRRGAVNMGNFSGTAKPLADALAFGEGYDGALAPGDASEADDVDCRVRLLLRSPYLVVEDNRRCGGVNVSFAGIYARASK